MNNNPRMKNRRFWLLSLAGLLLLSLLGSGCTPAMMAVPPGLRSKTDSMPITYKGHLFSRKQILFGDYVADDVIRGMRVGGSVRLMGVRVGGAKQGYSFELLRGRSNKAWKTRCIINIQVGGVAIGGLSVTARRRRLNCSMISPNGQRKWMLNFGFRDRRSNNREGDILMGKRLIRIAPNFYLKGQNSPMYSPSGFVFRFRGRTIGAVDVLNGGVVYIRRDLPPGLRRAVSMASIAMLLNRQEG
jgi:hypothetical protein